MSTESCSSQAERTISISGIWLDALSRYKAETGIDLKEEQAGEYRLLAECNSLESALRLTAGLVDAPSLAQASSWKQTQDSLCKVFKLVLVFNDATAELVASLVRVYFLTLISVVLTASSKYREGKPSLWRLGFFSR
jgi:hypothetical protein